MPLNTFPTFIGLGWDVKKRVLFSNQRETSKSGAEFSTANWTVPHYEFDLDFNFLSQSDRDTMEAFYEAQLGGHLPFLLSVTNDNRKVAAPILGPVNGSNAAFVAQAPAQTQLVALEAVTRTDWQGAMALRSTPRTNLLLRSQEIDNAAWGKSDITVTANTTVAPDGTTTAESLVETAPAIAHFVSASGAFTVGKAYAYSVFAKELGVGAKRYLIMRTSSTPFAAVQGLIFDLSGAGAVTSTSGTCTGVITPLANGWYRCTMLTPVVTVGGSNLVYVRIGDSASNMSPAHAGDAVSGFAVWGAQLEEGSAAGSYIPTGAATATLTDYTASLDSKTITLGVPPVTGATLTWTGTYAYVVKFKDDKLEFNQMMHRMYENKKIVFRTAR